MAQATSGIYKGKFLDKFLIKGRTIVITGGGGGLGFAFADGLAQAGANIAVIDIAEMPGTDFGNLAASYQGKYAYYRADVTDYEGLKKAVDRIAEDFGGIYGCIAAAGTIWDKPFLEHTPDEVEKTLSINVKGVFFTIQLCAAKMKEQGTGGSIVAIASTASYKSPAAYSISAYTASKYAVRGLVGQIAKELASYDIRVNTISPGCMQTQMLQAVVDEFPERLPLFVGSAAMKRMGRPEELAGMMLYLMSDVSTFTTGQDFLVDGGSV